MDKGSSSKQNNTYNITQFGMLNTKQIFVRTTEIQ